jgi:hypothetical protein
VISGKLSGYAIERGLREPPDNASDGRGEWVLEDSAEFRAALGDPELITTARRSP